MSLGATIRSDQRRQLLEPSLAPLTIDWDLGFTREPTRKAFAYWGSLCNGRKMPRRQELSPAGMRVFLQHVNLIDIVREVSGGPADYIVTLEGQYLRDIYGAVAHRRLHEVLPAHVEQRWRRGFGAVSQAARPVRVSSSMLAGGNLMIHGEVLIAPLGDETRGVESLFVAIATWPALDTAGNDRLTAA